jgi:hypothetical protein
MYSEYLDRRDSLGDRHADGLREITYDIMQWIYLAEDKAEFTEPIKEGILTI